MNYTRPNSDEADTPKDWLNSALIFTRTLSILLADNEGVVVNVVGDMINPINPESKQIVVFRKDGMVHIDDVQEDGMEEGTYVKVQ